jgi:hypothetical protein
MELQVFELLNSKINDRAAELKEFLSDGGCKSFDHYKEVCGAIRGLRTAQMELNDLVRKLKEADDE